MFGISCAVRLPKDTWNPWSYDIFDELAKRDPTTAKDEGEATKKCKDEIVFVSELDEVLVGHFGRDYLIKFTEDCHPNRIRDYRLKAFKILKERERDSSDENEYEQPTTEEIIQLASGLDLKSESKYTRQDIPRLPLPIGIKIHLKVATFTDMDRICAYPIDEPFLTYRRRLCAMLEEYCEDPKLKKPNWMPDKGQLCFVKVPTWAEIDEMMLTDKGKGWKRRLHRRTNEDDDGWMAGKWFRGTCISSVGCNPKSRELSIAFEFFLVDVGRNVPIHKDCIQFAVLRFATIPPLSIRGWLVLKSMTIDGDTGLPPKELKEKWYSLFQRGTVFPCTVLYNTRGSTMVEMPIEYERKFDEFYKNQYPQLYEKGLAAIEEQNRPKIEEKYLLTINDLNFDF